MQPWDVIIIGAGPAGCAAAYDLAAAGRRVLLLDKAEFPRPKACAGGLTMRAVRALRYSVAPVVRRTVREIVLESDGTAPPAARALPVRRRSPLCLMTVRAELDAYCLAQTREAGAVFQRIAGVDSIEADSESVSVRAGGETFAARYLVGADGVHSRVRALTQPESPWFHRGFALEANVPLDPRVPAPSLIFDFAPVPGGYGWLFPRHDHVNVGLYTCEAGEPALDRAALAAYIEARCGTRSFSGLTGQFLGMGAERHDTRDPDARLDPRMAGRVLLAGDAAGFVDPLTGEGIYGAIASGQAAAAAVLRAGATGAPAAEHYRRQTARLRGDLRVAASAARSFYAAPTRAFDLLRYAPVRQAAIQTFSHGSSITTLAAAVGALRRILPHRSPLVSRMRA